MVDRNKRMSREEYEESVEYGRQDTARFAADFAELRKQEALSQVEAHLAAQSSPTSLPPAAMLDLISDTLKKLNTEITRLKIELEVYQGALPLVWNGALKEAIAACKSVAQECVDEGQSGRSWAAMTCSESIEEILDERSFDEILSEVRRKPELLA